MEKYNLNLILLYLAYASKLVREVFILLIRQVKLYHDISDISVKNILLV